MTGPIIPMQPRYVSVPTVLKKGRNINAYSDAGFELKATFHAQGKAFLTKLAKLLDLPAGSFEVRSNLGGVAVSGEVTLHSDDLYLQMSESAITPGVSLLYRTCNGRKDYCGHQNRFVKMDAFSGADNQTKMVAQLRALLGAEKRRKAQQVSAASL